MGNKVLKRILIILIIVLTIVDAILLIRYLTVTKPYNNAYNTMPADGDCSIVFSKDGSAQISWPEAKDVTGYIINISYADASQEDAPIFQKTVQSELSCTIPDFPFDKAIELSVNTYKEYESRGDILTRIGSTPREYLGTITMPQVVTASAQVDIDTCRMSINYVLSGAEEGIVKGSVDDMQYSDLGIDPQNVNVQYDANTGFILPRGDQKYLVEIYPQHTAKGFIFTGIAEKIAIERDEFFGTELDIKYVANGDGTYSISWEATKGIGYEIQKYNIKKGEWQPDASIGIDDERIYTTPNHSRSDIVKYRVVALGEEEYVSTSEKIIIFGTVDAKYCTVWPNKKLTIYNDAELTKETGKTVPAMKALCVLEETGGAFKVMYEDTTGYIDSNYCLINLSDYLGNLCSYNITNSYASKYLVHEFEIPEVTSTVVAGYEKVKLKDGEYLVPYLYPCAKRLASAAKDALMRGYKLKVYDAYRPNIATLFLYEKCSAILDNTLPEVTYTGVPIKKLNLPEGYTWPSGKATAVQDIPEELIGIPDIVDPLEPPKLTYRDILITPKYALHYFIAEGKSNHNFGIAIDITIESLSEGDELVMQTSMHDLSAYSIRENNNENANLLSDIMTQVGYQTLVSEWWHFNDKETMSSLSPALMSQGVSLEGWKYDGTGWKYRKSDGSYYKDTTKKIDGNQYTFDSNGYTNR